MKIIRLLYRSDRGEGVFVILNCRRLDYNQQLQIWEDSLRNKSKELQKQSVLYVDQNLPSFQVAFFLGNYRGMELLDPQRELFAVEDLLFNVERMTLTPVSPSTL